MNYEAPTAITVGEAHDLILGEKPEALITDNESVPLHANRMDDIDESED